MAIKSEKIDLNNLQNSNDIVAVTEEHKNDIPADAKLLDKNLLPSRGKFYSENIYVRELTTKCLQDLATITPENASFIFNAIIEECVFGIQKEKIFVGDKLWFIYYLRAISYDDAPFKIKHKCKDCDSNVVLEYKLENLNITYLDNDIPEYIELSNGDQITVKFPTIGDEAKINKTKNLDIPEIINENMLEFSSKIDQINGKRVKLLDAYHYVKSMRARDFSKLINSMSKFVFTVAPYATFNCPLCGEEIVVQIPFSPTFFMPEEV